MYLNISETNKNKHKYYGYIEKKLSKELTVNNY